MTSVLPDTPIAPHEQSHEAADNRERLITETIAGIQRDVDRGFRSLEVYGIGVVHGMNGIPQKVRSLTPNMLQEVHSIVTGNRRSFIA